MYLHNTLRKKGIHILNTIHTLNNKTVKLSGLYRETEFKPENLFRFFTFLNPILNKLQFIIHSLFNNIITQRLQSHALSPNNRLNPPIIVGFSLPFYSI